MKSINPATEEVIKEYKDDDLSSVQEKLKTLQQSFQIWKQTSLDDRIKFLINLAQQLQENKDEYAAVITAEMGKVTAQAVQEITKCASVCKYYAEHAKEFLLPKYIKTEAHHSYVSYQPLGIILGVMPWNFPFWQVFRFAVPTLLAGNVIMLKHASCVPGSALLLQSIFNLAAESIPDEIFKTVLISGKQVDDIIAEPAIQAVSLTGSVAAGKSVASAAGKLIKKTVLELGGSDPYIVLADADIEKAVIACATSRLNNAGQSCIAAKRFIVVEKVYDEFVEKMVKHFVSMRIGDPSLPETTLGPVANEQVLTTLIEQVDKTIAMGATCKVGGKRINTTGYFYQPTILTDIPINSPGYNEELFGPVACIFKVHSEQEAITLANATNFGLGAAIFSRNIENVTNIAETQITAGNVFVNSFVASDPRLPFGGVKQSGYGRELAEFGIHEFVNIKTISIS
jgi:succinate-semialdehyde dehydrogenase/glutarate-semialdehyde dehydrogenase